MGGTLTMFSPPFNSHGLYPPTPPIDASNPPSSGVVASLYHQGAHQYLRVFARSDRLAPQALERSRFYRRLLMLKGSIRCVCARFNSPVAVDQFYPSSYRLSNRSIVADGRVTVISFSKTNPAREPSPPGRNASNKVSHSEW